MSIPHRKMTDWQKDVVFTFSRKVGDRVVLGLNHAQNTNAGTQANQLLKAPWRCVVEKVRYYNATGLAADGSNYAVLTLKQGATVCAQWSTQTGQEGAIAVGYQDLVLSATAANLIVETDEALTVNVDETGTTTVPAGRFEVTLRIVEDDVAFKFFKAKHKMRVDSLDLQLVSGLAASNTDYYTFQVKNGATVVASYDTRAANEGALTAATFGAMTLSATQANRILAVDDVLTLDCNETGDAVLSDITLTLHARYV